MILISSNHQNQGKALNMNIHILESLFLFCHFVEVCEISISLYYHIISSYHHIAFPYYFVFTYDMHKCKNAQIHGVLY